jgi:NADH-quinone oxidoreductase subunit N
MSTKARPHRDHGAFRHRAQGGGHGAVCPGVHDAFGGAVGDWQQIVAFLSVLSMFLGAIAAIGQTDIKRLMAYSSISHMGFALMGLAAGTAQGVEAMLIYMAIYVTMNIGTFAFILTMEKDGRHITEISALSSFASRDGPRRWRCWC